MYAAEGLEIMKFYVVVKEGALKLNLLCREMSCVQNVFLPGERGEDLDSLMVKARKIHFSILVFSRLKTSRFLIRK